MALRSSALGGVLMMGVAGLKCSVLLHQIPDRITAIRRAQRALTPAGGRARLAAADARSREFASPRRQKRGTSFF